MWRNDIKCKHVFSLENLARKGLKRQMFRYNEYINNMTTHALMTMWLNPIHALADWK